MTHLGHRVSRGCSARGNPCLSLNLVQLHTHGIRLGINNSSVSPLLSNASNLNQKPFLQRRAESQCFEATFFSLVNIKPSLLLINNAYSSFSSITQQCQIPHSAFPELLSVSSGDSKAHLDVCKSHRLIRLEEDPFHPPVKRSTPPLSRSFGNYPLLD